MLLCIGNYVYAISNRHYRVTSLVVDDPESRKTIQLRGWDVKDHVDLTAISVDHIEGVDSDFGLKRRKGKKVNYNIIDYWIRSSWLPMVFHGLEARHKYEWTFEIESSYLVWIRKN